MGNCGQLSYTDSFIQSIARFVQDLARREWNNND